MLHCAATMRNLQCYQCNVHHIQGAIGEEIWSRGEKVLYLPEYSCCIAPYEVPLTYATLLLM